MRKTKDQTACKATEITPEMIDAGLEVLHESHYGSDGAWMVEKIYMAMENQSLLASSTSDVK